MVALACSCTLLSGGGRAGPSFIHWSADVPSCFECVLFVFHFLDSIFYCNEVLFESLCFVYLVSAPPPLLLCLLINKAVDL